MNINFAVRATVLGLPLVFLALGLLIIATKFSRRFCPVPESSSQGEEKKDKPRTVDSEEIAILSAIKTFRDAGRDISMGSKVKMEIDGKKKNLTVDKIGNGKMELRYQNRNVIVEFPNELSGTEDEKQLTRTSETKKIKSPMPGKILEIFVEEGQKIKKDQELFILEAMKMENTIQSPNSGTLISIKVKENSKVDEGQILAEIGGN